MRKILSLAVLLFLNIIVHAQINLKDGLIADFPFNGNADDKSVTANNGNVVNATLTTDRYGNDSSAYLFDGNEDYIQIPHNNVYNSQNYSISFWFYKQDSTIDADEQNRTIECLLYKGYDNGISRMYDVEIKGANAPFNLWGISNRTNSTFYTYADSVVTAKNWHHFVWICENNTLSIYLDNKFISSTQYEGTQEYNTADMLIGKNSFMDFPTRYFSGKIDDLKIYNRGLNTEEVEALYLNLDNDLIADFPFTGDAKDYSKYTNNASVYGATLTTDRFGNANSAYFFDGLNNYIQIPHNDIYNQQDYSISLWFNKNENTIDADPQDRTIECLLYKGWDNGISRMYDIEIKGANAPFNLWGISNQTTSTFYTYAEGVVSAQEWHHFVWVCQNKELKLYLDNKFVSSVTYDSVQEYNTADMLVGKNSFMDFPTRYFSGKIDDIKIYKRELSPSEINTLYGTKKDIVEEPNSIAKNNEMNISVYPNPVVNELVIKTEITSNLEVLDISGKLIKTSQLNSGLNKIPFHELNSGIYILKVTSSKGIFTQKIVK